jgi:hypothetical protein
MACQPGCKLKLLLLLLVLLSCCVSCCKQVLLNLQHRHSRS